MYVDILFLFYSYLTLVFTIAYLFFGTINYVEERARALLDQAAWNLNPIRFLIMDLSLCLGVDLSAAEAFVRIQRILASKGVSFILCGFTADSTVGRALTSVDLFASENVELFASMNEAMECEFFSFSMSRVIICRLTFFGADRDGECLFESLVFIPKIRI